MKSEQSTLDRFHAIVKSPTAGLYISKHFVQRCLERKVSDVEIGRIVADFKNHLCERLYECELNGGDQRKKFGNMFVVYSKQPDKIELVVKTTYRAHSRPDYAELKEKWLTK